METFDIIVIGSGPGGYPAAIRAAQLGAQVALVEKEALGGTCLNWGCIPTKTLIASADLFARIKNGPKMGIRTREASFDYSAIAQRKDAVVDKLTGGVGMLLKANGVTVIDGEAAFTTRNRIVVRKGKQETTLEAAKIIIATGSAPVLPGFIPKHKRVLDSRAFLDLTDLPKSLVIMGGGVIGCEFACMAAMLGSKVTLVEMLDDILIVLDKAVRRELSRHMKKELGITILTGKPFEAIKATNKGISGKVGDDEIEAEALLVSIGRKPYTEGLALDKAGLEADKRGAIPVSDYGRTTVAGLYAIGDVRSGSTQLAHAATAEGIAAAEDACGMREAPASTLVPACIFTHPEIGAVGLTENEAKEQGIEIETGAFTFNALGRALAAGEPSGHVKWVARADTGQLIGAHAVGTNATDLIAEAALAIQAELTVEELGRTIHAHPTFAESWMEAAHAVHGTSIHAAPKRRR